MRKRVILLGSAALLCAPAQAQMWPAPAPNYGAPQVRQRVLNPRDVAEAARDHPAMVQSLGGEEGGPRAAYVRTVGQRVGAFSGVANPGRSLQFITLNSPVENALSVPGGYVYITRQLMALMDDESELAFALGHEVAHIAANHAHARQAYAQRNPLGIFGQILGAMGPSIFSSMISSRAKLDTLRFSRDQEYAADRLGRGYLIAAGYDPAGAAGVLAALSRNSALQARLQGRTNRQTPEWASSHPLSQNRMQRELAEARASGRIGTGQRNRDAFLRQIDGQYVDDDPAQGIIEGTSFTHPDLRIQFRAPQGFMMSNGTRAVTVSGSAGRAQFGGGQYGGPLEDYIQRVYQEMTRGQMQLMIPPPQRTLVNGVPAAYTTARIRTSRGMLDASVIAYQWGPQQVYHFVTLSQAGSGLGPFAPMVNSLRRISAQEAAAIQPRVIRVVTVAPGDTVQGLAGRMAYRDFRLERFLALNGLQANSQLQPGRKVKLVVIGNRTA
ncbi:MAG: M48 family metalloprotease [Sphingomicrobium sp.]